MCIRDRLTVARVIKRVQSHSAIMLYLPTVSETGKQYIEREFLFDIVNTIDPTFFRDALAELEARRGKKAAEEESSLIEIDKNLFELLQQCQSRMSGSKLAAGKRAMHALTNLSKVRKTPQRNPVQELEVELKPKPKLSDDGWYENHADLFKEVTKNLKARKRFE